MRKTLTAMAFVPGSIGLGSAAQAAPVPASLVLPGLAGEIATPVQTSPRERRMISYSPHGPPHASSPHGAPDDAPRDASRHAPPR